MEFLAGLPPWALYGAVGAIIGAALAALGWVIEQNGFTWGRYLPILAFVTTQQITDSLIVPSLEPYRYCSFATEAQRNTSVGVALDEYTTFVAMHVDCAQRSVVYDMKTSVASTDITDPSAWGLIQADFDKLQCGHASWRRFVDAGWQISNDYFLADGMRKRLTASC